MERQSRLQTVIDVLFLLLVGVTPLIVDPLCHNSFEPIKQFWLKGLLSALLLTAAARVLWGGTFTIVLRRLNLAFLLFFVYGALTVCWAQSGSLALDAAAWLGWLLLWVLLWQNWIAGDRRRLVAAGWALIAAAFVTASWTVLQDFAAWILSPEFISRDSLPKFAVRLARGLVTAQPRLADWRGFLGAGFGNTGHIADFLALSFLPALMMFFHARGKWREVVLLLHLWVSAAALIVCWSVHSNLGLMVAAVVLGVLIARKNGAHLWRRRKLRCGVLVAGWLGIVLFYVLPSPLNPHSSPSKPGIFHQAFGSPRWKEGGDTRLIIWLNSLESAKTFPVLGAGVGNFAYVYPQRHSSKLDERPDWLPYAGKYTNAAHNELLETWIETGAVGVALLLLVVIWAAVALARRLRTGNRAEWRVCAVALCMLIAFAVDSMLSFPLRLPYTPVLFWALVSIPGCFPASLAGRFPLRVSADWGPLRLTLLTTGMRRIESASVRLNLTVFARWIVVAALAGALAWKAADGWRVIRADREFKKAYETRFIYNNISPDPRLLKQAGQYCQNALDLDPRHADARSVLSDTLIRMGKHEEALKQLPELEKRFQANEIWLYYGQCHEALKQFDDAGDYYDRYIHRYPSGRNDPAYLRWTKAQSAMRKTDDDDGHPDGRLGR